MLDIKEYLKQTKTVLVTQDAFDELVKKASARPEIIRCRDCKEYSANYKRCRWWNHETNEAGWCCYAERREG